MTNDQYGNFQTPSSRPPEPPYRADQPITHDTSGTARQADEYATGNLSSATGQQTESFTGANDGNTASIPQGQAPYRASNQSPRGNQSQTQASYEPLYNAKHVGNPAPQKKSSGAGKAFLFGFLGALLACAIGLGGFIAWSNFNTTATSASTTIGTTDQSVINAVEEGQTLAEAVAAKALPSVVAVYNYQQQQPMGGYGFGRTNKQSADDSSNLALAGMGSGVLISDDGYILTNYHVVDSAGKLTVKVGDGERDATYIGGDESSDVAIIKISDTSGLKTADIGNSDNLVIGEWVMTVGAPLGLEQSVATGVVSATNRSTIMDNSEQGDMYSLYSGNSTPSYTYYPNMIQTDAVINPGNSGGALVDADGKLIGINTMISSYSGDYAGVGFAIPVNYAMGIAEQIMAGKEPTHAILGVSISSVNSQNAQRYGLSSTSGAYIASIAENTGAAQSDLKEGDIITQVDDTKVSSTTDVTLEVREHNPGDTVTVTVNRNGETLEIPVVLSSDENASKSSDDSSNGNGNGNGNQNGRGNGMGSPYGNGQGGGSNGYTEEELEEILRMLGM